MIANNSRLISELEEAAEERGIEQGIEQGKEIGAEQIRRELVKNLFKLNALTDEMIAESAGLPLEVVVELKKELTSPDNE